jgi:hypothetical protein
VSFLLKYLIFPVDYQGCTEFTLTLSLARMDIVTPLLTQNGKNGPTFFENPPVAAEIPYLTRNLWHFNFLWHPVPLSLSPIAVPAVSLCSTSIL